MAREVLLPPTVLCIGGHDPSGGAGLQADIEAVAACGGQAQTLPTCLTAQNRHNAMGIQPVDPAFFQAMLDCLQQDNMSPAGIKFGLLASEEIIDILGSWLNTLPPGLPVVLDPVLRATGGANLSNHRSAEALMKQLLPLATVVTPNQSELRALTGLDDIEAAAEKLLAAGANHVLVTGGDANEAQVTNRLYGKTGRQLWQWTRLPYNCHGSGCTLASALATFLAHGEPMARACEVAQHYTQQTLQQAVGADDGPRLPRRILPVT